MTENRREKTEFGCCKVEYEKWVFGLSVQTTSLADSDCSINSLGSLSQKLK